MLDNLIAFAVAAVLYPIAYAYQMLPDGEMSEGVIENTDELGYYMGDPPNYVAEVPVAVPDTFPEEWAYAS